MAIQELDLRILHRSGKHNANADALSRAPLASVADASALSSDGVVAAAIPADPGDLPALQRRDPELASVLTYLEAGVLPEDKKAARRLALTDSQYVVQDVRSALPCGGR